MTAHRRLRLGMVGGGEGSLIGPVHRIAARLDDRYALVAGALSSRPEKARESGLALGLSEDRIHSDYEAMAEAEAARDDGIEVVAIVTPNHLHLPAARAFMARGIHVICDKPLAASAQDAKDFARFAETAPARFFLTHNYSGYPMVRRMREMVAEGALGRLRVVNMEYIQGWLAPDEVANRQAQWRADPAQAGAGGALGDIGTHAYHLASYVTGLRAEAVAADLHSYGTGRMLDDNAHLMVRFGGGVSGAAWISQVAAGIENALRLRVVGTGGTLDFRQEEPNRLIWSRAGAPRTILTRGGPEGGRDLRLPAGHPEGFLEGFATLYRDIADALAGDGAAAARVPGLADGLEGMAFIGAAVASSAADGAWVQLDRHR